MFFCLYCGILGSLILYAFLPVFHCQTVLLQGRYNQKIQKTNPSTTQCPQPSEKNFQAGEGESHRELGELSLESLHIDPQGPGPAGDKHGNPLQVSEIQEQQEPVPP